MVKQEALVNGMPHVRYVHASRTIPGPADVDRILKNIIEGLGGSLLLASVPGEGTSVSIILPVSSRNAVQSSGAGAPRLFNHMSNCAIEATSVAASTR